MRSLMPVLALTLLLGGCASGEGVLGPARAVLSAETEEERTVAYGAIRADLDEALRSAKVHEDRIAVACWQGLLTKLDAIDGDRYFTDVLGAASGFQKARNIRRKFSEGVSEDIVIACAALKADSRSALLGIARLVGIPVP